MFSRQRSWSHRKLYDETDGGNNGDADDDSSSPSDEASGYGGYLDRNGNPNPHYVVSSSVTPSNKNDNDANDDPENNQRHHQGFRSYQEYELEQQRIRNQKRLDLCTDFFSDLSFFFGSSIGLWLVLSEGGDVWGSNGHHNNDDDGKFSFALISDPSSDSTSTSGVFEDSVVWMVGDSALTRYMIYGITAGCLFVAAGALRLFTAPTATDKVPYVCLVLAAVLSMAASALREMTPFWSHACSSVSVHIFALQAATLLLWKAVRTTSGDAPSPNDACRLRIRMMGDALLLLATLAGIALGYLHLFDATQVLGFSHDYLALSSASVWWMASILYLAETTVALLSGNTPPSEAPEAGTAEDGRLPRANEEEAADSRDLKRDDTESTGEEHGEEEDDDEVVEKVALEVELISEKPTMKTANNMKSNKIRQAVAAAMAKATSSQSGDGGNVGGGMGAVGEAIVEVELLPNDRRPGVSHAPSRDDSSASTPTLLPHDEEEGSVLTNWTAGPGPTDPNQIAKSSLDHIFGRSWRNPIVEPPPPKAES